MPAVIELDGLRKQYRRFRKGTTVAVDGLDLSVPEGGVFGFLGPNGSGKTTTIRCLLGLSRPTSGAVRILGADATRSLPSVIARVGSVVETPALFPSFSGRRNLQLLGRIHGIGDARVDAVLDRVGLGDRGRDRVRTYSLGMRQRLGIAAALLKDPELLVLDEPANGLDPAGIKEMRELLRSLGAEGRTVFVSSHILSEIQQTCDRVAILTRGRCVASGSVDEVVAAGRGARAVLVRVDNIDAGTEVLRKAGFVADRAGDAIRVEVEQAEAGTVTQALARKMLWVTEMRSDEASLEDVFLDLTGEGT